MTIHKLDPKLDLVLERVVDVPPALVWEAWTKPEHLRHWFTPKPWTVAHCEVDLRPGGTFRTIMRGPNGEEHDVAGCYLEIVPQKRLIWTDALLPGFRPSANPFFTAIVELEPSGKGTRYTATAIHRDEDGRKKHEEMGFHQGWGTVLDQLVEYAKAI
ncbi:MAG: SRPBCC family protein [Proteobacteria bacterium]|nr:SRPBCC family protein [Pseudomonadota bacterium]